MTKKKSKVERFSFFIYKLLNVFFLISYASKYMGTFSKSKWRKTCFTDNHFCIKNAATLKRYFKQGQHHCIFWESHNLSAFNLCLLPYSAQMWNTKYKKVFYVYKQSQKNLRNLILKQNQSADLKIFWDRRCKFDFDNDWILFFVWPPL